MSNQAEPCRTKPDHVEMQSRLPKALLSSAAICLLDQFVLSKIQQKLIIYAFMKNKINSEKDMTSLW
ncbi:MAG: hypothetical protein K8F24_02635, partial [Bacteroidales bacterium]|nr:hypothetical protein [Bacteroidales bacterium]